MERKEVKWSCHACGANGIIEYTPPGNPYLVGHECEEAHSKISPDCKNHMLRFDPEELAK